MSVNIHDRKSSAENLEYSQHCVKFDLPELIRPFQNTKNSIKLCMLLAESTLFFTNPLTGKLKTRGGHIAACELLIPPSSDPAAIKIDKVISKLPGGTSPSPSAAKTRSGKILEGQNYEVPAKYETSDDVLLFRDTNSPIDSSPLFAAPVFIALIEPNKIGFNYTAMYRNSLEIADRDRIYRRIGGACGEYLIESYYNGLSADHRTGMATQEAFDLLLTDMVAKTQDTQLLDSFYQARKEILMNLDPSSMYKYGVDLVQQYRETSSHSNAETLKNSTKDANIDYEKVQSPLTRDKKP